MTETSEAALASALQQIADREPRPPAWSDTGNLPWDNPGFSERMLRVHLDEKQQAATRPEAQRKQIIAWLTEQLSLNEDTFLLDLACGPGLYAIEFARRKVPVTGIDFAPAAVAHAQRTAAVFRLEDRASFVQADIRLANLGAAAFDAVIMLYGQLTVFRPEEMQDLLQRIHRALVPGGLFAFDVLDPDHIDYSHHTWWRTADKSIWSDEPHLDLGESYYDEAAGAVVRRHHVVHLASGELQVVSVCDQVCSPELIITMLQDAGFASVDVHREWAGLDLPDAKDWIAYIARAGDGQ